jgi:hypothetical protein
MLIRLLQGVLMLGVTVAIHAAVLGWMLHRFQKSVASAATLGFTGLSLLLTRIASITVIAHLLEITIWALWYRWSGALPSMENSFYFSSVTYATIGYGDIVLPAPWRLHAAMEGLTGILMCGWSGAFFFAAVNRLYLARNAIAVRE